MSQKWESLSVIRSTPPAYGVCRAATCKAAIEWVQTTGKGAKISRSICRWTSTGCMSGRTGRS